MLVSERFAQNNARSLMIVVDLRHLHLQLCLVPQHERLRLNLFIVKIDAPTNTSVPNLPRCLRIQVLVRVEIVENG